MARLPTIRPAAPVSNPTQASAGAIEAQAAVSAFGQISRSAAQLRQQLQPELDRLTEERAAQDVQEAFENRDDPNSLPNVAMRRAWTQQDQVYNQAVEAGVAARAGNDLEAEASRLREQFQFDPAGYETAARAFTDSYIGEQAGSDLPMSLVGALEMSFEQRFQREQSAIADRTRELAVRESQEALETRLNQINSAITTGIAQDPGFTSSEDFASLRSDAINIVGSLANNPAFGWSDERAADVLDSIANAGQEAVLYGVLDEVYADSGEAGARDFIAERVNEFELSIEERIGLQSRLLGRMNQSIARDNVRRQDEEYAHRMEVRRNQAAFNTWEASVLSLRIADEPIPADLAQQGIALVGLGGGTSARVEALLSAPTADSVTEDQTQVARVNDLARAGAPLADLQDLTLQMVGNGQMRASTRETVLARVEAERDERVASGLESVQSFFSQSGYFEFDSNLPILEDRVRRELMDWADANPEATRSQIERQAVMLSIARGRQVPPPPLANMPAAPQDTASESEFRNWVEAAEIAAVELYDGDDTRLNQVFENIETYQAWWEYQAMIRRAGSVNNGGE